MKPEKTTLLTRILFSAFSAVVAFIVIASVQFVLFAKDTNKGGSEVGIFFISSSFLWKGSLIFLILSFLISSDETIRLWGKIFETDK
tara:strand:- start:242 stop:502 length:261 start_codon:yes stop_codon:yes gene_type:complete